MHADRQTIKTGFLMKIAILTLPLETNYGGVLQAYALQKTLERLGHRAYVINKPFYHKLPLLYIRPVIYLFRFLNKKFGKSNDAIRKEKCYNFNRHIRCHKIQHFVDTHINQYIINSFEEIDKETFDAIVVGSDQIWRPKYFKNNFHTSFPNAFLSFTEGWNLIRIAFAASYGTDNIELPNEEISECNFFLNLFDGVSVREESGIDICKNIFGYESAFQMPDPTLLLPKNEYMTLCDEQEMTGHSLLVYFLDYNEDKINLVNIVAKEKKTEPYWINMGNITLPSIGHWLSSFRDAEYVVTDSFHACVFSIIFHKPFIVYGNSERGLSRFTSLLKTFHLEERMILNTQEFNSEKLKHLPDDIENIIIKQKEKALAFLSTHLC